MTKRILLVGYGELAQLCAKDLDDTEIYAVSRREKPRPDHVTWWQGNIVDENVLAKVAAFEFDAVVITLSPDGFNEEAYQRAYIEPLKALLKVLQQRPPKLVLMSSSTGVYHHNNGEWVNEDSLCQPQNFSGRILLEAEALLHASGLPSCCLRLGGVYGPGRDFLIRDVQAGKGGSDAYTNRIHSEDAAGIILFLYHFHLNHGLPHNCYLGCDSEPAPGVEVRGWLARKLGIDPQNLEPSSSVRGGNKRCSNQRLLDLGYQFKFENYREGYDAMLEHGR